MRERSEAAAVTEPREEADVRGEADKKRVDLSLPQVAGSALAAVVAAKLASSFGVYGTILGAGVVSAIATCGGTLFQHFFKRTGEQLRATGAVARRQERPRRHTPPAPGEFTEGTVYRARVRGWKRPVVAAALVFGVTMAGITVYELASGHNLSGGSSTTVGDVLTGHDKSAAGSEDGTEPGQSGDSGSEDAENSPEPGGSATPGTGRTPTDGPSGTPGSGTGTEAPDASPSQSGGGEDGATPAPSASGSQDSGTAPSPAPSGPATAPGPSAGSRSETGAPGPDGPATP
ncbi:hypothetical protein GTU99_16630 [Streptomyces sp. PRKS01-65]|nr:hypothetical protein [Streptomyces harenosi]NEY33805.1 hypothetical protein [Streptomyces harenosi]